MSEGMGRLGFVHSVGEVLICISRGLRMVSTATIGGGRRARVHGAMASLPLYTGGGKGPAPLTLCSGCIVEYRCLRRAMRYSLLVKAGKRDETMI